MPTWALVVLLILLVAGIVLFFWKLGGLKELYAIRPVEQQQQHANTVVPTEIGAANQSEIERCFPVRAASTSSQCSICIAPVEEGEPCRHLQCDHIFHADCIMHWWMRGERDTLECPVCRQQQKVEISVRSPSAAADPGILEFAKRLHLQSVT